MTPENLFKVTSLKPLVFGLLHSYKLRTLKSFCLCVTCANVYRVFFLTEKLKLLIHLKSTIVNP